MKSTILSRAAVANLSGVPNIGLTRDNGVGLTPMIQRLEEERDTVLAFVDRTVEEARSAGRDLSETEESTLTSSRERVQAIDRQLTPMREMEQLRGAHRQTPTFRPTGAPAGGDPAGQGGEQRQGLGYTAPRPYEYRSAGEFMADAWRARNQGDERATARLESHGLGFDAAGFLTRAAPNVVTGDLDGDTQGIIPRPIVGEIFSDLDAERPFINSIGAKDLSGIPGKTFTRPFVATHTSVAAQSSELSALQTATLVIDDVDFTKGVYGGYAKVSRQSIEWSSPAVWDALLKDFQEVYGLQTENAAADAFVTAVQAGTDAVDTETAGAEPTVAELLKGLYAGAVAVYNGSKKLPDIIWQSLDEWALWGPIIDAAKATTSGNGGGESKLDSFTASMLNVPRIVVPSFASGVTIIGRKNRVEVYEERYGFLSAVQPTVLGVDLAYGGAMASGVLNAAAFAELTFTEGA